MQFSIVVVVLSWAVLANSWAPVAIPCATKWSKDVTVDQHPSYPRPQLTRSEDSWHHLNGLWQLDYEVPNLNDPPFGKTLAHEILVPYPLESSLSGVRKQASAFSFFYRRIFGAKDPEMLPQCKGTKLLHVEKSDWNTTVYVNKQLLGTHIGGFDPFTFEVRCDVKSRYIESL
jgi:hypothetical protein